MLQDARTVIRGDFDQETAKKIAPPIIARLDLTNCTYLCTHTLQGGDIAEFQ